MFKITSQKTRNLNISYTKMSINLLLPFDEALCMHITLKVMKTVASKLTMQLHWGSLRLVSSNNLFTI